jgi:hypothetical protein
MDGRSFDFAASGNRNYLSVCRLTDPPGHQLSCQTIYGYCNGRRETAKQYMFQNLQHLLQTKLSNATYVSKDRTFVARGIFARIYRDRPSPFFYSYPPRPFRAPLRGRGFLSSPPRYLQHYFSWEEWCCHSFFNDGFFYLRQSLRPERSFHLRYACVRCAVKGAKTGFDYSSITWIVKTLRLGSKVFLSTAVISNLFSDTLHPLKTRYSAHSSVCLLKGSKPLPFEKI